MNERLLVRSFGPIRDLDITFKKITLFIGDQGSGKSCIAKLFSMFKWLEKVLSQKKYSLSYFEQYNRFKSKLCAYHRIESFINEESYILYEGRMFNFVYDNGFRIEDKGVDIDGISKIMYIPAERSIVSVAENKSKLLKELPDSSETFSDEFVNAKKYFKEGYNLPFEGLRFEYDTLNDVGWIHGNDYKVRLINASSGIQSSLPMCMVSEYLCRISANREDVKLSKEEKDKLEKRVADIMNNADYSDSIKDMMIRQLSNANRYNSFINIVEEPELSLFPYTQMKVAFSLVSNNEASANNQLLLTTHSPYMLAILNTLILAGKVCSNGDEIIKESVRKTLGGMYAVDPNNVAAYRLDTSHSPYCKEIIDNNTQMISKNQLDSASEAIMQKFNTLYRLYAKTLRQ